jgi:hypothetical protein
VLALATVLLKPPLRLVELGELVIVERQLEQVLLDAREEERKVRVAGRVDLGVSSVPAW